MKIPWKNHVLLNLISREPVINVRNYLNQAKCKRLRVYICLNWLIKLESHENAKLTLKKYDQRRIYKAFCAMTVQYLDYLCTYIWPLTQ